MKRNQFLDQMRGFAVALMIFFHLFYDLNEFSFLNIDFIEEPFWYGLPRLIVTLFFLCVGSSLYIVHNKKIQFKKFFRRWVPLVLWAFIFSLVTYFLYPKRWVYFGTLHSIATCSLLALPFVKSPKLALVFSVGIWSLFFALPAHQLDFPKLVHITSMDYIPFLPWLGMVTLGIYLQSRDLLNWSVPNSRPFALLAVMGRHALVIYVTHQPLLYAFVAGLRWIVR